MSILLVCMSVHHMCAYCPWRTGEDIRFSRTKATGVCEPLCRYQESNLDPLAEQPVLLANEPPLSPATLALAGILAQPRVATIGSLEVYCLWVSSQMVVTRSIIVERMHYGVSGQALVCSNLETVELCFLSLLAASGCCWA